MKTKILSASIAASLLFAVLPAAAQTTGGGTGNPVIAGTVDTACLGSAADTLTQNLSSAIDVFSQALKTAYTNRATAWKSAWALKGKDRQKAVIAADKRFRSDSKTARVALNQARRDAWSAFTSGRKSCKSASSLPTPSQTSE